jgi:hypothetical protein
MRKWAVLLVLFVASSALGQTPAVQPAPIRPVGTMSELMARLVYPTSDSIFYIETSTPTSDAEWNKLQTNALTLGESANLLMMPGRARDNDRWMSDSRLLLEAATAAFKAAKIRDVPALSALNDQLYTSCTTCHRDYRPNYGRGTQRP